MHQWPYNDDRCRTPILRPPETPASLRATSAPTGPRTSVGAHSLTSFGKGTIENQDSFLTSSSDTGSKLLVGVFDGHGEQGGRISNYARNALGRNLFGHKDLHSDPGLALESAYRDTQKQIEREEGQRAAESGTTAVAAYQNRDNLFVANVGDSRAVLGRCDTAGKNLRAVDLSDDHKPDRADERHRIEKAGGKVDQMAYPVFTQRGGVHWMRGGPPRVMDKTGMGGLAMSRSLGDLSLRPYVTAQPELVRRKLDERDKLLILGSDGVWDHISSQEAIDIAGRHGDPNAAAREITGVARRRWNAETEGQMSDDITAVVVRLNGTDSMAGTPSKSRSTRRVDTQSMASTGRDFNRSRSTRTPSQTLQNPLIGRGNYLPMLSEHGGGGQMPRNRSATALPSAAHMKCPELLPPAGRRCAPARR